jgi:hypothetical protein
VWRVAHCIFPATSAPVAYAVSSRISFRGNSFYEHNYYSATSGADFNYLNVAPGCYFKGITVDRLAATAAIATVSLHWLFGLKD